eukprot:7375940-Prymnesium_polylepis.1
MRRSKSSPIGENSSFSIPLELGHVYHSCTTSLGGLWPMVRHTAVLERYTALRFLWHGVRVVGRSNR